MKKTNRRLVNIIRSPLFILIIFLLIVGCVVFYKNTQKKQIILNPGYTSAIISAFLNNGKGQAGIIVYNYQIKEINYQDNRGSMYIFSNKEVSDKFRNQYFPMVYDTLDPTNTMLLITPGDFSEYNLPYPDSLKWVLPYFEN